MEGVQRVKENVLSSIIARGWKPQMSIIGAGGLPSDKTPGNVMLPYN